MTEIEMLGDVWRLLDEASDRLRRWGYKTDSAGVDEIIESIKTRLAELMAKAKEAERNDAG